MIDEKDWMRYFVSANCKPKTRLFFFVIIANLVEDDIKKWPSLEAMAKIAFDSGCVSPFSTTGRPICKSRVSDVLSGLARDGLIARDGYEKTKRFRLTEAGEKLYKDGIAFFDMMPDQIERVFTYEKNRKSMIILDDKIRKIQEELEPIEREIALFEKKFMKF